MFKRKTFLTLALLTSVISLTACGQKSSQSTPASSQSKVVQASSSSSLSKAKTTTSTETSVNQEEASSEAPSTETSNSSGEASPAVTSSVDLDAIANGDFSSIVGTWSNAQGRSFTFTADGLLSDAEGVNILVLECKRYEDSAVVTIGFEVDGKPEGGALGILIYPAGVKTAHGEADERDHLQAGHSVQKEEPQERFYRQ